MKENKKLSKGFTIAEILISMIVISVIIAASASLITVGRLALGSSKDVQSCVVKDGGSITSANCMKAILSCKYNLGKAYQSLLFFANGNTASSSDAAKTVLKETCRQGGSRACDYFIEQCVADSTKCDVSGSTNDLRYFLDLSSSDSSAGKTYIYNKVSKWYKDGITNIINAVNNSCEANGAGIACTIYLKQKTYNFDRSERADFNEQDSVNGTVFDNGIVKLLMPSGTFCWGLNSSGQLGNNSTKTSITPANVSGGHDFYTITSGPNYECALERNTNNAYCWGDNGNGQLGNNSTTTAYAPKIVKDINGNPSIFTSISAGSYHTCGLDTTGTAWCWGANGSAQLGDGTATDRRIPVKVNGYNFTSIALGFYHTCGLDSSGNAWCWGNNSYGGLGDGTTTTRYTPVKVIGYTFTSISAGNGYTCGIDTSGDTWCWGTDGNGQLGSNANLYSPNPVEVVNSSGVPYSFSSIVGGKSVYGGSAGGVEKSTGYFYAFGGATPTKIAAATGYTGRIAMQSGYCGLDASGNAYCWGVNNDGQLGSGDSANFASPHAVVGGHIFSFLDATAYGVCGLETSGNAYCWGNQTGGIGDNSGLSQRTFPVRVVDSSSTPLVFSSISTSNSNACGIDLSGNVWCWGNYASKVAGGIVFSSVSAAANQVCALTSAGNAYCWGNNTQGQLGTGNNISNSSPQAVVGGHTFKSISAGGSAYEGGFTCGVDTSNHAWCWGYNGYGELGNGSTTNSNIPVEVVDSGGNPYSFSDVKASSLLTGGAACGLDTSDHAWCWGFGSLGNNTAIRSLVPQKVLGLHKFTSIEAGFNPYTCGIDTAGDMWCWGYLNYWLCPSKGVALDPIKILGGPAFSSFAAGQVDNCGIDASGKAWCYGYNPYGQLGDGTTTTRTSFGVQVSGNHVFSKLSGGLNHFCGVLASGTASTPISYWLSTTTANHITDINKIISVSINQSADNANAYIKWLVSFDNWATCKTWDSTNSVWVAAANCSAASAVNTSDDIIQGLHDYEFASGAGSLDFKAVLYNTDGVTIPDIDQVVVNYY